MTETKETKNASQVLLELQQQVQTLTKICQDNNSNIKILLKNVNMQNRTPVEAFQPPTFPQVKVPEEAPVAQPSQESGKSSNIEQVIVYKSNDRPVLLAKVEVFDLDAAQGGVKVTETLTSASGKWTAKLPKGKYRAEIKKGPVGNNQGFITKEDFEVSGAGAPVILEKKVV